MRLVRVPGIFYNGLLVGQSGSSSVKRTAADDARDLREHPERQQETCVDAGRCERGCHDDRDRLRQVARLSQQPRTNRLRTLGANQTRRQYDEQHGDPVNVGGCRAEVFRCRVYPEVDDVARLGAIRSERHGAALDRLVGVDSEAGRGLESSTADTPGSGCNAGGVWK